MTPALNKYGVNFDIVREIPTQYDKDGHLTYLVLDKDDYWRYEADVELSWTNADGRRNADMRQSILPEQMRFRIRHMVLH